MREYEIVARYCNGCSGSAHPQTWFEEAELRHPDDYVRQKHGRDFDRFTKEILPDGRMVYSFDNGCLSYTYEFTEL